jgi:G3E family GTPase
MLGGFLGAGKTTGLLRLALSLQRKELRVGLITNDQASGLVDSALAEELNLPVKEIAGGCFCCRSESLVEALDRLETHSQPQVFLAEPVGSCTDLVATVSLPLERIYQKGFVMAPYAVVVDPYRAMQSLGVEGELLFSPDVNYIYRKQLEEAEIIVINKVDVISPERLAGLRAALEREYPETRIMEIASRDGTGVEALFDILGTETGKTRQVMEMDYERYAVGGGAAGLGEYPRSAGSSAERWKEWQEEEQGSEGFEKRGSIPVHGAGCEYVADGGGGRNCKKAAEAWD